ncbi:MAG: copper resistance protein NlpE [Tannerellaceae bacterium]|nr:copper resistance protein NlpE [Tannerellaceae bacterium]
MRQDKRRSVCLLPVFTLLLATACTHSTQRQAERDAAPESEIVERGIVEHDAADADIYQGILPVEDDPGVKVEITLTLYPDQTYTERMEFANREGEDMFRQGTYTREDDILVLQNPEGARVYYRQEGNRLHNLDENRESVSDPARWYVLDKQSTDVSQPYPEP